MVLPDSALLVTSGLQVIEEAVMVRFTCERFWKMLPPDSRMRFHLPLPCSRTLRMR